MEEGREIEPCFHSATCMLINNRGTEDNQKETVFNDHPRIKTMDKQEPIDGPLSKIMSQNYYGDDVMVTTPE